MDAHRDLVVRFGLTVLVCVLVQTAYAQDMALCRKPRLYDTAAADVVRLVYPKLGCPVIVARNRAFDMRVQFGVGQRLPLGATLVYAGQRWPLKAGVARDRGETYFVPVEIPPEIPTGCLYDLEVSCGAWRHREPHAVMLVEAIPRDFDIIQITDTEIHDKPAQPSEHLSRAIEEINLISPAFVIASGDLTYSGKAPQYEQLIRLFLKLRVPLFTAIGNADYHGDAALYFERLNAFHDYAFQYGRCHVASLDSGTNHVANPARGFTMWTDNRGTGLSTEQIAWLDADLAAAPSVALRLVFMHFPAVSQLGNRGSINFNRELFKDTCRAHDVRLVLAGHTHVDAVYTQQETAPAGDFEPLDGPAYVQTGTTSSIHHIPFTAYNYRLIRIRDGRLERFTYDADHDGKPDATASVPVGELTIERSEKTVGDKTVYEAVVQNNLYETFDRAQVRFRVPGLKPLAGRYKLDGAQVAGVYPTGDGQELVAAFFLAERATVKLTLEVRN